MQSNSQMSGQAPSPPRAAKGLASGNHTRSDRNKGAGPMARPAAFMSYVHFDDEHDGGYLTRFCDLLSGEVRMQSGQDFPIFQDRSDIEWGDNWKRRIDDNLDGATMLIVIMTPNYFKSEYCKKEFSRFRSRERLLHRRDLILPVYYVTAHELGASGYDKKSNVAKDLVSRQYADWREHRFEPLDSPVVRKAIERLAVTITAAF